jgi:hypothetical protein
MRESDRQASLPERGNEPVVWSGLQTAVSGVKVEKNTRAEPRTKHEVEAVRLCARSSRLTRRSAQSRSFASTVNSAD